MSEQEERWLNELEQATAPADEVAQGLDGQTAELREGWLALAGLLERVDAEPWPAERFLDRVSQTRPMPVVSAIAEKSAIGAEIRPRTWGRHRWTWVAIAGGAVAASLLVAAAVIWGRPGAGDLRPGVPQIAQPSPAPSLPAGPTTPVSPLTPGSRSPATPESRTWEALAWDDPLNEQFDQLASGIASFRASQSSLDASCDWLDRRLEGLSAELGEL